MSAFHPLHFAPFILCGFHGTCSSWRDTKLSLGVPKDVFLFFSLNKGPPLFPAVAVWHQVTAFRSSGPSPCVTPDSFSFFFFLKPVPVYGNGSPTFSRISFCIDSLGPSSLVPQVPDKAFRRVWFAACLLQHFLPGRVGIGGFSPFLIFRLGSYLSKTG